MIKSLTSLVRKAASKPLGVVWFRLRQEIDLALMRRTGGWRRIERKARRLAMPPPRMAVLATELPEFDEAQLRALSDAASRVRRGSFDVLGSRAPDLETCDFSQDWRYGYSWPKQYYKHYSFYEAKQTPYDVKMPWELSRMGFLVPVLAEQAVAPHAAKETAHWVNALLLRWEAKNPLAESVNWYPMEASMRAVTLVLLLDLVRLVQSRSDVSDAAGLNELAGTIVRLIYKNAMFVWKNREYTDVRGNHFTANIVALYLSAHALGSKSARFERWRVYSRRWIGAEIDSQFCADGVNFEKSLGYHKLVLELFTLAAIAADAQGEPLPDACLKRLQDGARFSDAATRPDGLTANFGDTDDASALPFTLTPARNHGSVVEVWRALQQAPIGSFRFSASETVAAAFLTGRQPTAHAPVRSFEVHGFSAGGFYLVRNAANGFFFMADMGEVGMKGRGGHGHNDLFSFELFVDGRPVVVDPGCPVYTGDLNKRAWFRSTSAHATVSVFGSEMADITGPWTISDHARPSEVVVLADEKAGLLSLSGCHKGFSRICPGTTVCRRFDVDALEQTLSLTDEVSLPEDDVPVRWCFPTTADVLTGSVNGGAEVQIGPALLTSALHPSIVQTSHSEGYGQEQSASAVICQVRLPKGAQRFTFRFAPASKEKAV